MDGTGALAGKRVVLATFGSLGDLHPFLALAKAVESRGGVPVIATSGQHRERVERLGITFAPVRPHFEGVETDPEVMRRAMDLKTGGKYVITELILPHLRASFEDLSAAVENADLLVTQAMVFAGPLIAERTGLPWTSVALSPLSMFSKFDPPIPPPAPWLGRLRPLGPAFWGPFHGLIRRIARSWTEPIRALRRELGLPPSTAEPLMEGTHSPRRVIALFSSVLGTPQPDWPAQTVQTGFAFFDDSPGQGFDPALDAFLDAGSPPLVFTLGSAAVMDAGRFYEEGLAAARALGRRAVLLVGRDPRNRPAGPTGDSVYVAEYVPYSALFPRAAAIVHQGGVGTTGQALRAGRPMVIVPWSHDQPDNAERVRRLGIGAVVPRKRFNASSAVRALRPLLDDTAVGARAEEIGRRVRSEGGGEAACDVFERDFAASRASLARG